MSIICCSAGVGRTGTYITLDNVLDQIEAENLVDIDGIIVKTRNQRMKMVQTKVRELALLEYTIRITHLIMPRCTVHRRHTVVRSSVRPSVRPSDLAYLHDR